MGRVLSIVVYFHLIGTSAHQSATAHTGLVTIAFSIKSHLGNDPNCTPGYYNNEGQFGEAGGLNTEAYGPGINAFNDLLAEWRAKGDLEGLELG